MKAIQPITIQTPMHAKLFNVNKSPGRVSIQPSMYAANRKGVVKDEKKNQINPRKNTPYQ